MPVISLSVLVVALSGAQSPPTDAAKPFDISSTLMGCTFRITGPSTKHAGEITYGTAFVVIKPAGEGATYGHYVLITAAHVLSNIQGTRATLAMRRKNQNGVYVEVPINFRIRDQFRAFYVTSAEADVATAYIDLPDALQPESVPPIDFLVDDQRISYLEIHPGDEMLTLGFPLYASLNTFPVLRSGIVASYPLTPMKTVGQYYLNFRVFEGNSGGPAYFQFDSRTYSRGLVAGSERGILGLVSKEVTSAISGDPTTLDVSVLVPSAYIRDAIASLGPAPMARFTLEPVGLETSKR